MRSARSFFHLFAAALLALTWARGVEGRTSGVLGAPGQVASAVFIQQWSQVLWGLVTSQTGTQPPSFGEPIFNPDGSVTQSFTAADGTEVTITAFLDGSARLDILLPDGTTQTVLQSVPRFDGVSRTSTDWELTSSDGLSVDYTSVVDDQGTIFDISDDITQLSGSSVLPGDLTQTFNVTTAGGWTELESAQSDGSTFTWAVPLGFPEFMLPDWSQQTTGTYRNPSCNIHFTLTSTPKNPSRWAALLSDLGGGLSGTFSLNNDFSGFGQFTLTKRGRQELVALLSWTQAGESEVYLLSGESRQMGPAGAALAYLQHRWQTLTGLLGPAPGVNASTPSFRRPAKVQGPPRPPMPHDVGPE